MTNNWNWIGEAFLSLFAIGALIIAIAFIMLLIWFILPNKHKHHHYHRY